MNWEKQTKIYIFQRLVKEVGRSWLFKCLFSCVCAQTRDIKMVVQKTTNEWNEYQDRYSPNDDLWSLNESFDRKISVAG